MLRPFERVLKDAYELAVQASDKNHQRNKKAYDLRVRPHLFKGDRVFVRALGGTGKQKLKDKWNSTPYIVVEKLPNLPVYRVKPEKERGGVKTLHRDHLLLVGYLIRFPDGTDDVSTSTVNRVARTRQQRRVEAQVDETVGSESDFSVSDGEENYAYTSGLTVSKEHYQAPDVPALRKVNGLVAPIPDIPSACEGVTQADTDSSDKIEADPGNVLTGECEESNLSEEGCVEIQWSPQAQITRSQVEAESLSNNGVGGGDRAEAIAPRERRTVKPVIRFTYDELGEPSDQPVVIHAKEW